MIRIPTNASTAKKAKAAERRSKIRRSDLEFIRTQLELCAAHPEDCYADAEAAWRVVSATMTAQAPCGDELVGLSGAISDIQLFLGAWETDPDYMEGRADLDKAIHAAFEALAHVERTARILKK